MEGGCVVSKNNFLDLHVMLRLRIKNITTAAFTEIIWNNQFNMQVTKFAFIFYRNICSLNYTV